MELLALILDTCGTLLIAYAALNVHHRFRHEHKIDEAVFKAMKYEHHVGWIGIALILTSFIIELVVIF